MFLAPSAAAQLEQAAPAVAALRGQHPMFGWFAGVCADLWQCTADDVALMPAPTKPSDGEGLLAVAREGAAGCVQVFQGPGVEWYAVSAVAATKPFPFGMVSSAAYASPLNDVPHLSLQAVPTGPDRFLFYASLQPRVDVVAGAAGADYLRRFYLEPPPTPPSTDGATNGAADGDAAADGAAGAPPQTWHALMQAAWALPGWEHYRSRGLEMGAMGQGLDIFGTLPMSGESMTAVGALCHRALDLWLGFLAAAQASGPPGHTRAGVDEVAAVAERRRRDDALRALLLKDPDAALGERLLGPELHTLLRVFARQPEVLL